MIKEFFYFPKSDRRVIIFLLVVIVLSVIFIGVTDNGEMSSQLAKTDSLKADTVTYGKTARRQRHYVYNVETAPRELFAFDPNTADSTQLLRLGLQPWQVQNIYKYRAKGGIYRRPSDFARLYGLTAGQYRRLEPYIRISDDYRPAAEVYAAEAPAAIARDTLRYTPKLKPGQHVALNAADTALLKRVPGIGSSFAAAIVRYRERLGGFYSTAQLREISNFPQAALPYFTADARGCRKLNVNRLTLNQLRRHPYIGFYRAKTIIDHRRLHGPLHSLDDLRLYKDFPPEAIERLRPYVKF